MPDVLIHDVPDEVHAVLQRKAEDRHQSLQQFLAAELWELAERRTVSDILDEVEEQRGGRVGLQQAAADLHRRRR